VRVKSVMPTSGPRSLGMLTVLTLLIRAGRMMRRVFPVHVPGMENMPGCVPRFNTGGERCCSRPTVKQGVISHSRVGLSGCFSPGWNIRTCSVLHFLSVMRLSQGLYPRVWSTLPSPVSLSGCENLPLFPGLLIPGLYLVLPCFLFILDRFINIPDSPVIPVLLKVALLAA